MNGTHAGMTGGPRLAAVFTSGVALLVLALSIGSSAASGAIASGIPRWELGGIAGKTNFGGNGSPSGLELGKPKLNQQNGTAVLPVTVKGSGRLSIDGTGVVKRQLRTHRLSKAATYRLKVIADGSKQAELFDTGEVRVKPVVTFKPTSGHTAHGSTKVTLKTPLIQPTGGVSVRGFFTDWYPVFGVFFMAALLGIFILIYKGTLGATRPETVKATHAGPVLWEEVQGVDAAKSELLDVTEWLKDPDRFEALGARAPRGVLLYGPPGTGKTMLARAVAAQAGVDFFSASGSSFVEMFVGRGAARIRRLFREARKGGRAVIFIDELDAVGGHRGSGAGDGGTSEREQALNQLLVELDGFERDPGTVIVIAASNNVEKLDPALLRPGRFDRQVLVAPPDRDGREAILHAHARNKPLGPDLDMTDVARKTTGMTGAQLANALNEAAIIAGRLGHEAIARDDLDEALLRQSVGSQQARRLTDKERRIVAYHEAGHALCRRLVGLDPPEIMSIVPRGPALGFVASAPSEDRYLNSRKQLLSEVVTALGGRAAEEEVFGEAYSGAADDLARVHKICVQMVTEFGMTVATEPLEGTPLALPTGDYALSDATRRDVDLNAQALAEMAFSRARQLLALNRDCLVHLATNVLERETLTREDLDDIFDAHELSTALLPQEAGFVEFGGEAEVPAPHLSSAPAEPEGPQTKV
ncbi:MAG: AAA family ATPase [Actinomycetota bacterium]|nr:AAA family ATPase [Actinomycetota bacterium]